MALAAATHPLASLPYYWAYASSLGVEGKEVTGGVKKETLIFKMATDLGDLIWRPDPATDLGGVCRVCTGRRVQLAREASCGAGGITTGLRHLVWVWRGRGWQEE